MAQLTEHTNGGAPNGGGQAAGEGERPFPPGDYPAVVVGSGPGGLQVSHALRRLGVDHAVISADPEPGGMFRHFPIFQRLLSWTKPYAPVERGTRAFERYDWNSLVSDDASLRGMMPKLMDGTSEFPSRPEMERNLATFAERAGVRVRYGCSWERTSRADDGRFVIGTSDGDYTCRVAVFAVGVTQPWRPRTRGIEDVPHYTETQAPEAYADRRVFLIGKQVSAFEIANGLLHWARQIILASPSPTQLSVVTNSLVGVRARYVQPYEDYVLGGGVFILDASIDRIERRGRLFHVHVRRSADASEMRFDVDDVIAATGFQAPLRDLPDLGVAVFSQGKLPTLTPYWESATVPGIYFAGSISQAAGGLKKHGLPSNSGAVNGFRYNAQVLAAQIARQHFGIEPDAPRLRRDEVVPYLVREAGTAPELWHQRSYLCRVVNIDPEAGARDAGILPLAHFVDAPGPDAAAITIEADTQGVIRPALYVRRAGRVDEHVLEPDPLLQFAGTGYERQVAEALRPLMG